MFQFQCPQCATILQADPAQAGQQSQCPICQAWFIIPAAEAGPGGGSPPEIRVEMPTRRASRSPAPGPRRAPPPRVQDTSPVATKEPEILHIPCPQCRKVLEAPDEMLDQDVLCPYCETQFRLERRDSLESRQRREQERQMREHRVGKMWFRWAIAAVVAVAIFLLFLVFSSL